MKSEFLSGYQKFPEPLAWKKGSCHSNGVARRNIKLISRHFYFPLDS